MNKSQLVVVGSLVLAVAGVAACTPDPPPRINIAARTPNAGPSGVVGVEGVAAFDRLAPAELQNLRQKRVFFGHQSVGRNLLDGARALGWEFATVTGAGDYQNARHGEALVPENGDPQRKIRSFTDLAVARGIGGTADLVGFKFCWIDFNTDTDLDAVERAYDAALRDAMQRFPRARFFHVTPPLTSNEHRENRVRLAFGDRLRARYGRTAVVFNLAEVMSTRDDGTRCSVRGTASLCDEFRSDEGHLNDAGSRRAAKAFLFALHRAAMGVPAQAPPTPTAAPAPAAPTAAPAPAAPSTT